MTHALALAPTFGKGIAVVLCAVILFVGSVYVILTAVFGLRMGYLVLAVSFFGWMIVLSVLWVFGAPGTPRDLGPRGTEPHWQVFAAATQDHVKTRFPETQFYPKGHWQDVNGVTQPSKDTVTSVFQGYLQQQAAKQLGKEGKDLGSPVDVLQPRPNHLRRPGHEVRHGRGWHPPGGRARLLHPRRHRGHGVRVP